MTKDPVVKIILPANKTITTAGGRSLQEIGSEVQEYYSTDIVGAVVNGKLKDLAYTAEHNDVISFLDLTAKEGARIYRRSLTFLLIYAARQLFPDAQVKIEHSLGKGLYCEIEKTPLLNAADVASIAEKMREIIARDLPIEKRKISIKEALAIFKSEGFEDKVSLYKRFPGKEVTVYSLDGLTDSLHGYMVSRTGVLKKFALLFHAPGLVLRFPGREDPFSLPPYVEQKKLFNIFRETEKWMEILGFETVGVLNDLIEQGHGPDIIRINEALHEKKIARIADEITEHKNDIRVILIAGPSSSGKTTFAQRLRIQSMVNGIRPYPISIDDYFLDRDRTPLDESGEPDFEHIEAIDLALFNEHLTKLISGKEVEIPTYNFSTGKREYRGHAARLQKGQPLILEGIHGLNERLTASIPRKNKYKIYISALTALSVDRHTRIHTTDTRLLRRIVRDKQFRGISALETIRRWPSVRRGEERDIFWLQEEADIMFNSSLVYEAAVLKEFAVPLLQEIKQHEEGYIDAKRLLLFLSAFVPLNPNDVPSNSILREFIGESCFFHP